MTPPEEREPQGAALDEPDHRERLRPADRSAEASVWTDGYDGSTGAGSPPHEPPDEYDEDDPGEPSEREGGSALSGVVAALRETVIVVVLALVLSFIVKSVLLQAFYIPSGSMEDTLIRNDRVIVSKLTPGPLTLKRGDIVVFADPGDWLPPTVPTPRTPVMKALHEGLTFVGLLPDDAENHLIKRVIGLPGDHVTCCDGSGRIQVNGVGVNEPYLKPGVSPSDMDFDITVPAGKIWVMGDNRSNSSDSRFHPQGGDGTEGSVSENLIVGRAVTLVWPLSRIALLSNPSATFERVPDPEDADPSGSGPGQGGDDSTTEPP